MNKIITAKVFFAMLLALQLVVGCVCFCKSSDLIVDVASPDGKNEIRLWEKPFAYEILRDGVTVVAKSVIDMKVDGRFLSRVEGGGAADPQVTFSSLAGTVATPIYKKSRIDLSGNEAFVDFGDWGVRLAARNDGVAYRFETKMPGKIKVNCEKSTVTIPNVNASCSLYYGRDYGCEEKVPVSCATGEIATGTGDRRFVYLPFVWQINGRCVAVTESDVRDYPVMNLTRMSDVCGVVLTSEFAHWPTKTINGSKVDRASGAKRERRWVVAETADYLVETDGMRTYPWRTFILGDTPTDFLSADIVMALARQQVTGDFSWVKPGKVAWDWWNAWDNQGEKDGCNTATYKRFVDFASKNGVEYVILDEGWSEKLNIWKFHPNVDVPEIVRYGNEKGVGIILWMAWAQIVGDEERVARHFARLGVKGIKVDFIDRGDAAAERFLWTFADACSKNKLLVDYHGVHRPTGVNRTYPNVIGFEGVHGLECMKFYKGEDFREIDVRHAFLRMTAGPMDYTPGAMDNYIFGHYKGSHRNPGSIGTRTRQMAMMVLYEAPLQMLCDAPTKYEKNMECFRFMVATPVVWSDTIGLGGSPDTFVAVARKAKDGSWYVAAINSKEARDFILDTSFLGSGEWNVEVFRDALDAAEEPTHYVHETNRRVDAGLKLVCRMEPGGGFVIHFSK